MSAVLEVKDLRKSFGAFKAVEDVSFEVAEGELVSLLGPSGCGKTTTLRCVAGLETFDGGEILLDGRIVSSPRRFVPPHQRNIGMVFQSYAMWPHMTVEQHLDYGLKLRRMSADERAVRIAAMLDTVGLSHLANRFPSQLSGGQQQRVALARALVLQPKLVLFDEPLSNLDAKLRASMRDELKDLKSSLSMTAVYVTHDQSEAMVLSDRIVVMSGGHIIQTGSPDKVYRRPRNRFVAEFMGTANIMPVTVKTAGKGGECDVVMSFLDRPVRLSDVDADLLRDPANAAVRAEWIDLAPSVEGKGIVKDIIMTGERVEYHVDAGGQALRVSALRALPVDVGDRVSIDVHPGGVSLLADDAS